VEWRSAAAIVYDVTVVHLLPGYVGAGVSGLAEKPGQELCQFIVEESVGGEALSEMVRPVPACVVIKFVLGVPVLEELPVRCWAVFRIRVEKERFFVGFFLFATAPRQPAFRILIGNSRNMAYWFPDRLIKISQPDVLQTQPGTMHVSTSRIECKLGGYIGSHFVGP